METYVVLKNGECKLRYPGEVKQDGTVWLNAPGLGKIPVVLSSVCARLGLDTKKVSAEKSPPECLGKLGTNEGDVVICSASEFNQMVALKNKSAAEKLEREVPGITEIIDLHRKSVSEYERHDRQFTRMMNDENNDGCRPPRPENLTFQIRLTELLKNNPRAELYLKAKSQRENCHWSDNTGSGAAGARAMEILEAGGSIDDALIALDVRRELVD